MPVDDEKRTVIGVDAALKWYPLLRDFAAAEGVKVPFNSAPRACAVNAIVSQWLWKASQD